MFHKQWVIDEIFSEKAKKVINFSRQLGSEILCLKKFRHRMSESIQ